MVDALSNSNDDAAKIFKYRIRVHDLKKPLNLPFYRNSRGICCSSATLAIVSVKHSVTQLQCRVNNTEYVAETVAAFYTTNVTILPLAIFTENRLPFNVNFFNVSSNL